MLSAMVRRVKEMPIWKILAKFACSGSDDLVHLAGEPGVEVAVGAVHVDKEIDGRGRAVLRNQEPQQIRVAQGIGPGLLRFLQGAGDAVQEGVRLQRSPHAFEIGDREEALHPAHALDILEGVDQFLQVASFAGVKRSLSRMKTTVTLSLPNFFRVSW